MSESKSPEPEKMNPVYWFFHCLARFLFWLGFRRKIHNREIGGRMAQSRRQLRTDYDASEVDSVAANNSRSAGGGAKDEHRPVKSILEELPPRSSKLSHASPVKLGSLLPNKPASAELSRARPPMNINEISANMTVRSFSSKKADAAIIRPTPNQTPAKKRTWLS